MATTKSRSRKVRATPEAHKANAEVQKFLDRFAESLTAGDGKAIADMWEVPALVLGDDMAKAVSTQDEVEEFFGGAKEQYNKRGITDTRADIMDIDWATPRIAVVDVRWPYLDKEGEEIGEESSSYTLRRDDDGQLKVRAVVMRGEKQR